MAHGSQDDWGARIAHRMANPVENLTWLAFTVNGIFLLGMITGLLCAAGASRL